MNLNEICNCEHITLCNLYDQCVKEKEMKLPCPLTDDPDFVYVPSASTDVQKTWRKFGWKPLEELRQH